MAKGSKKVTLVLVLVLALVANTLAMASPVTAQSDGDRAQASPAPAPPAPSGPPRADGAIGPRGETPPLPPVLAQGDNGLLTSPPTLSSSLQRPVQGPDLSSETITATSRHRVDRNGRGTAELYQNPAFRRQGGRWVEVDSSLHPTGDRALPAAAEGALRPVRLGSSAERIVELGLDQGPLTMSSPGLHLGPPSIEGNSALYRDVATDTDMRYVVSDDGIKEELVLRSAAAPRSFTFHLADPSGQLGTLEPDGAGGFVFSNPVEQGVSLTLPAALAWEQGPEGEPVANDSTSAHLEVVPAGDGWDLTVAVDETWLEDKSFPVVLDPSLTYSANSGTGPVVEGYAVRDTSSCGTSCRLTRNAYLFAGSWGTANPVRSYLRYDLSGIPTDARIDSASFNAYINSCMNTSTPDPCANKSWFIGLLPMVADWSATSTYAELAAATSSTSGPWAQLDRSDIPSWFRHPFLQSMVQDWVDGSRPNYGFSMRSFTESNTAAGLAFASSRWSVTGSRPYLSVSYTVVAPGTPAVAAYAGNGAARVHWGIPNSGGSPIDRYLIYAYEGSTFVGSKSVYCPCPTVAPFEGLTNGRSYTFKVYAHNSIGYSAPATSSAVTPTPALPTAPSPASASPGNAAVRVDWSHPSTAAAAVDHYVVQAYDTDTGYVGAVTVTCPCPTIAPVGVLANGKRYILAVFAHNEAGYGVPSVSGSVVPASNRPGPPRSVMAEAAPRAVDISWQAPATSGGASISSYTVRPYDALSGYLGDAKAKTITCPCATTAARVDGLAPGRTYVFAVVTTTANGSGAPGLSGAAELANVPGAPTSLSAVPGDGRAALSWDASGPNGSPVTGYTVTASPGGATALAAGDATSTMFEGLTNGTAYTFTAVATNAVGDSVASVASNEITPQSDSSLLAPWVAPTSVVATRGDTEAQVSWTKPTLTLPLLTTFEVTTYRASDGVELGTTSAGTSSTVTVTGLKNGTPVYFTVTAGSLLIAATSEPSNTVTPAGPPFAPTNVVATRGDRQVEVSWQPPGPRPDGTPGDNGDPISGYTVRGFRVDNNAEVSSTDAANSPATVRDLANGTAYYFTVIAANGVGVGQESTPSNTVVPAGRPFAPANVTATAGNGVADVTWTAPDDNGSPITSYTVTATPGGATKTVDGSLTSATITGLANGTTYTFTVVATNDVGRSATSAPSNAVSPAGPPGVPTGVTANAGDASAFVSWTPPSQNGSPIIKYTVTASPGGASTTVGGSVTSASVVGLSNGMSYTFTVMATNETGDSEPSLPSNSVTPSADAVPGAPDAPLKPLAEPQALQATVSWIAPNDNGSPITRYIVRAEPGPALTIVEGSPPATTAQVRDLVDGQEYRFAVTAYNARGQSTSSPWSEPVTPPGPANAVALFGMGDSYSAGQGNPPYEPGTDTTTNICHRSEEAYSLLAGAALGISAKNVACSSALISDVVSTSREGEPPQITRLTGHERYVALTLGGNDGGFGEMIEACVDAPFHQRGPCEPVLEERGLRQRARAIEGPLVEAYNAIKAAAPHADVLALGYPRIFPTGLDMSCEFVRKSDVDYINEITGVIDAAVQRAALTAGVRYVDMYEAFDGHELCSGQRWVHGIDKTDGAFGPQDAFFHPTVAGHLEYRNRLIDAMFDRVSYQARAVSTIPQPALTPSESVVNAGGPFSFVASGYKPGTEVEAVFDWGSHSPRSVGTATTDQDGRAAMTITVPADATVGEHELTAWGTNEAGYNVGPSAALSVVGGE